jgi:hypothetical protein
MTPPIEAADWVSDAHDVVLRVEVTFDDDTTATYGPDVPLLQIWHEDV